LRAKLEREREGERVESDVKRRREKK